MSDFIKTGKFFRRAAFDRATAQDKERRITLSFVSEEPVQREFGLEVLCCDPGCVRSGRLNKMPLLLDHDPTQQIGVIEEVSFSNGRGRAKARFSKNQKATEVWQDVVDGIRDGVSVGYHIHEMTSAEIDGKDGYRAVDWEPVEISLVAIAADPTVGIGRQGDETVKTIIRGVNVMSNNDIREILALGKVHGFRDEAEQAITDGKSVDQFRSYVLDELKKRHPLTPVENPDPSIGLTTREAKIFSFLKAIRAQASGDWRGAEFEREVSDATRAQAKKMGRDIRGIGVPLEVMKRDLVVGTDTAGGYTVATNLLAGSFIDLLRNSMQVEALGATVLPGLVGDVAIPKNSEGATAYWVGEGEDVTESQPIFDQVGLSPKSVGATTDLSRKLVLQSSLDIEHWVQQHLALILALAIDLAAINGSGTGNQPLGILNTTGIGDVAGGTNGAAPTWSHVVDLESAITQNNAAFGSLGYLTNAKVIGKLKTTEKASNTAKFIMEENEKLNGYKCLMSNQVPCNLTKGSSSEICSAIIFGNWADLIIGMWGALDINVDRSTHSASGGVRVVVFQDVDIAIRHAESFAAMQDVLTA